MSVRSSMSHILPMRQGTVKIFYHALFYLRSGLVPGHIRHPCRARNCISSTVTHITQPTLLARRYHISKCGQINHSGAQKNIQYESGLESTNHSREVYKSSYKHRARRKSKVEIRYTAPQHISVHATPKRLPLCDRNICSGQGPYASSIVQNALSRNKQPRARRPPTQLSTNPSHQTRTSATDTGQTTYLEATRRLEDRTLTPHGCYEAIRIFRTNSSPHLCLEVVAFATKRGYKLDPDCYAEVIEALAEVGEWKQIVKVLGDLKRNNGLITHRLYNSTVAALIAEKQLFTALEVMRNLKEYERSQTGVDAVQLDVAHYNKAIAIALAENKLTEALAFVDSLEAGGIKPVQESWGVLVAALSVIPETLPRALRYFDQIVSVGGVSQLPFRVYDSLLVACARAHYDERVMNMYTSVANYSSQGSTDHRFCDAGPCQLSITAFDCVVSTYARQRQWREANQALTAMLLVYLGAKCNRTCKVVLELCVSEGQWDAVQDIFTIMDDRGIKAGTLVYNSMIGALTTSLKPELSSHEKLRVKTRLDWILEAARRRSVDYSNHTYTTTIKALSELGEWERSVDMFRSMRAGFVARNESDHKSLVVAYKTIIETTGNAGQEDLRDELYLQMAKDCRLLENYWNKFCTEGLVDLHFHTVTMAQAAVRRALLMEVDRERTVENSARISVEEYNAANGTSESRRQGSKEDVRDSELSQRTTVSFRDKTHGQVQTDAVRSLKFMVGHGRNSGNRGPRLRDAVTKQLQELTPPIRTTFEETYATLHLNSEDLRQWLSSNGTHPKRQWDDVSSSQKGQMTFDC